ncbi:MAG: SurA N-terminal domain-containing protein, partial [Pseudomonadota bacterium]
MLVNDSPITNFEIEERAKLMALSGDVGKRAAANFKALVSNPRTNERLKAILQRTISENQGQPRQVIVRIFERRKKAFAQRLRQRAVSSARRAAVSGMKRRAREELIAERLKVQEAKRLGVTVSKERIDKAFADVAKRNGKTAAEFAKQLRGSGASSHTMKAKFKAQIAWAAVLGRRFRRLVSVSQRDVDDFLGQRSSGDASRVQLALITLPVRDILEGFNRVVCESILSGRPVVTSPVCPALSYMGDAVYEVPPNDTLAYGDALLELYENNELYE